jgi:hypothetical protein
MADVPQYGSIIVLILLISCFKISSNISPLSFLLFPAYPIKKWFNFESFGSFFLTSFFFDLNKRIKQKEIIIKNK